MTSLDDLGRRLARLEKALAKQQSASRLGSASLDGTALQVLDPTNGGLRGIVGVQADGTTAVNIVNGGPPPAPSVPTAASALGGVAVGWDGKFAGGAVMPLDFSRVEVHASATSGFTPDTTTLQATIETPRGAGVYVPTTVPLYVVLLARNTSGAASTPSTQVGPTAPRAIVDADVADGSITETKIADDAISTPKIKAGAIQTAQLNALSVTTAKLAAGAVDATALSATAITGKTITGGTVTGSAIQTGTTGARITLNDASDGSVKVYDSTGTLITSIGGASAAITQTAGATQVSLVSGGVYWNSLGGSGHRSSITSDGLDQVTIDSGYPGGGGADLSLNAVFNTGTSTLPYPGLPNLTLKEPTGVKPVYMFVSGAVVKTDNSGSPHVWHTPSYNANWSGSTTFNTTTGWQTLQYRLDAEDNLLLVGCFKSATGAAGTVFQLPPGYRPLAQIPVDCHRNNGGAFSKFSLAIATSGNVNVLSLAGGGMANGNEFLVNAIIPLGVIT